MKTTEVKVKNLKGKLVKVQLDCTTNKRFFTEVYRRVYTLTLDDGMADFESIDYCPSGLVNGGSGKHYYSFILCIDDMLEENVKDVMLELAKEYDSDFFERYDIDEMDVQLKIKM